MKLGIYTVENTLFEGEVSEVIAKTVTGEIAILANHIPLITKLVSGPIRMKLSGGEEKVFDIHSGYLEVQPENSIVVMVDS